jgi:FkbM family methyltransferase
VDISRIPRSSLFGRALRAPLSLIPTDAVVPIIQGPLRGKRWIVGAATHGCWLGTYEYRKQRLFAQAIRPGHVVYDVGANVGFYTLLAAVRAGAGGRVIAFEPLPRNVTLLRRHMALNEIHNVDVRDTAVSDTAGSAAFTDGVGPATGRLDRAGALHVTTVTLDESVYSYGMAPADVIKMDIEGGELRALRGAKRLLADRRPVVFLSTHGNAVHEPCCALLRDLGYHVNSVDGGPPQETDELVASA